MRNGAVGDLVDWDGGSSVRSRRDAIAACGGGFGDPRTARRDAQGHGAQGRCGSHLGGAIDRREDSGSVEGRGLEVDRREDHRGGKDGRGKDDRGEDGLDQIHRREDGGREVHRREDSGREDRGRWLIGAEDARGAHTRRQNDRDQDDRRRAKHCREDGRREDGRGKVERREDRCRHGGRRTEPRAAKALDANTARYGVEVRRRALEARDRE